MRIYIVLSFILIGCLNIISCDSTSFVYVNDKTFQKQLSYLEDGYVEFVFQVDPTKKTGYEHNSSPWPVTKENKFVKRSKTSDELCYLILNIIRKNQRYTGKGWHPTYEIYVKNKNKYLNFVFDFKNNKVFSSGRSFVLYKKDVDLIKNKLDILLDMNK